MSEEYKARKMAALYEARFQQEYPEQYAEILRLRAELADAKRDTTKQDIADAVAIHQEAFRLGWIAGRDVAGQVLTGVHGRSDPMIDPVSWRIGAEDGLAALRKTIRNMEPPA